MGEDSIRPNLPNPECVFTALKSLTDPGLRGFQQAKPLFSLDADFGLINEDVRIFFKYFLGFQTHKKKLSPFRNFEFLPH